MLFLAASVVVFKYMLAAGFPIWAPIISIVLGVIVIWVAFLVFSFLVKFIFIIALLVAVAYLISQMSLN